MCRGPIRVAGRRAPFFGVAADPSGKQRRAAAGARCAGLESSSGPKLKAARDLLLFATLPPFCRMSTRALAQRDAGRIDPLASWSTHTTRDGQRRGAFRLGPSCFPYTTAFAGGRRCFPHYVKAPPKMALKLLPMGIAIAAFHDAEHVCAHRHENGVKVSCRG